jgi:hypothetical protein
MLQQLCPPGNVLLPSTQWGRTPEPTWNTWRRQNITPPGTRTPISALELVAFRYADCAVPASRKRALWMTPNLSWHRGQSPWEGGRGGNVSISAVDPELRISTLILWASQASRLRHSRFEWSVLFLLSKCSLSEVQFRSLCRFCSH